jgi:hypothetical protein
MQLTEAVKTALHYRQCPMTAQQIAYFLCMNNIVRTDCLQELIQQVEEEVHHSPGHFTVDDELIYISAWREAEQQVIQHVFNVAQAAKKLYGEVNVSEASCNNLVLALLLYKRLSDIKRSQQHGGPIVPKQLKYDVIIRNTVPSELPSRVGEVMEYIECTDNRLSGIFLSGKEELSTIRHEQQLAKLHKVMYLLLELHLDEEHMPTPLFQAAFSRMFWNSVRARSRQVRTGETGE